MDTNKPNILVVDDEMGPRESLRLILNPYYNVHVADRGGPALDILNRVPVDLVTVDLKMPGLTGINILEKVKQHDPDIEAIIITGYGSLDTAIEGLRLGAFDYIAKPFDVNHILSLVRRGLERRNAKLRLRQVKSDFLASVSHELRTPLSVVVGFVYLLLNQVVGKVTDEQQKVLEKVYRNSEELLELIDNVLWMSSLNAGESSPTNEEFDVASLVQETTNRYQRTLREKGLRLSIEIPTEHIPIISDRSKVERVFHNIFNNAVKFTPEGEIIVKAWPSSDGSHVEMEIVDTGIGIEKDKIDSIFEPFNRIENSHHQPCSGLGLGLTVARRMTDMLGGTLEVSSEPGVGTHVWLKFPSLERPSSRIFAEQRQYG